MIYLELKEEHQRMKSKRLTANTLSNCIQIKIQLQKLLRLLRKFRQLMPVFLITKRENIMIKLVRNLVIVNLDPTKDSGETNLSRTLTRRKYSGCSSAVVVSVIIHPTIKEETLEGTPILVIKKKWIPRQL